MTNNISRTKQNILKAKQILRGHIVSPEEMYLLAEALREDTTFNYARQIFARLRKTQVAEPELRKLLGDKIFIKLAQKQAVCTYKDPTLAMDSRLDQALQILNEVEVLDRTVDQETLGIAGAIHKRKWGLDGQKQHLETSLAYYLRGYKEGPELDYGYTGINAAYVLDQLAHIESLEAFKAGSACEIAEKRREQAAEIRRNIIEALSGLLENQPELAAQWWFIATMLEAYFGLGDYQKAQTWIIEAKELLKQQDHVSDWEYESTVRQLASLALLQGGGNGALAGPEKSPAWEALTELLKDETRDYSAGVRSSFIGKVGLALSGGGFRASLFHIGVLAKLAELDVLRNVEVLSCVSGGSIIGAHYYLEVRKLLQEKADKEIKREDYIEIVKRLERDFLDGVQRNIRVRVAAEIWTNLKTVFKRNYSRTERVGELFESEIFSRVNDGGGDRPRLLNKLQVIPKDETDVFSPRKDNWRRAAKAPILILNATTLNTGHNWQFTTSWMGESAASINTEVDANPRLRRMYYEEAPEHYQEFSLGRAVAASASVPGLFDPIVLEELYPGLTIKLVDGGVHDNQGVAGLIEQDCNVFLVSDASGHMEIETDPSTSLLAVPTRSIDMLMARVRGAQYNDLAARHRSSQLRGLMFIHLKKDLDADPLDWLNCPDPHDASDESRPVERRGPLTSYGIRKDVQRSLAAIRTDLDAFSDTESFALMTSGYLMTEHEFNNCIEGFPIPKEDRPNWRFLAIEEPMKKVGDTSMMKLLEVAQTRVFKVWKLSSNLRAATLLLLTLFGAATLSGAFFGLKALSPDERGLAVIVIMLYSIFFIIAIVILLVLTLPFILLFLAILTRRSRGKTLIQVVTGIFMSTFGWVAARIQLMFLDRWYLALGSIKDRSTRTGPTSAPVQPTIPVRLINERIEKTESTASINKVVNRSDTIEAIGKLFEIEGYTVTRFPRDPSINPLQINLDLYAFNKSQQVFVIVQTASESAEEIDWRVASSLETATWVLSDQQEASQHKSDGEGSSPQDVKALLVLVELKEHESLGPFVKRGAIKLLDTIKISDVKSILEKQPAEKPQDLEALRAAAAHWLKILDEPAEMLAESVPASSVGGTS